MIVIVLVFFIFIALCQLRALYTLLVEFAYKKPNIRLTGISAIETEWPGVLFQIPVYNEGWEVKNAALAVMQQNYERVKICLQIIDDSARKYPDLVEYLENKAGLAGIEFQYLCRSSRKGYKSGALNYGMSFNTFPFIVVLDADFVVHPEFLHTTVPLLYQPNTAGVQTRWTYRNQFCSPTVTVQSTIFETIFLLEQNVRSKLNIPAFFTGTSAIWKRNVIEQVGGWKEEPFTAEDIDLSFRSYHLGYAFLYLDVDLSTCEATPSYISLKKQQQRWARGVFQAGIDNLRGVISAAQLFRSKLLEVSTVLYNLLPLSLLLFTTIASVYVVTGLQRSSLWIWMLWLGGWGTLFGPVTLAIMYAVGNYHKLRLSDRLQLLISSLLSMSLAFPIAFGLGEVLVQSKKEFVVTPKGNNLSPSVKKQGLSQSNLVILLELTMFLYFLLVVLLFSQDYPETYLLFSLLSLSGLVAFMTSIKAKYLQTKRLGSKIHLTAEL